MCPPSARPGAPGRRLSPPTPPPGPGRGGPGASSPARLRGDPSTPQPARCRKRGRAWAPATPSAPLGLRGAGRAGPGQPRRGPLLRGAKHATPRSSAAQHPSPSRAGTPSPRRRAGAPLPGRGARLSPGARACELVPPPASPHARQRAAFKSPGYSAGGKSMRAGAARRGRGEAGRRWGVLGGGTKGWGWYPREESGRSRSCLCSRDRDGQPPRGSQTALSLPRAVRRPLATKTLR